LLPIFIKINTLKGNTFEIVKNIKFVIE